MRSFGSTAYHRQHLLLQKVHVSSSRIIASKVKFFIFDHQLHHLLHPSSSPSSETTGAYFTPLISMIPFLHFFLQVLQQEFLFITKLFFFTDHLFIITFFSWSSSPGMSSSAGNLLLLPPNHLLHHHFFFFIFKFIFFEFSR